MATLYITSTANTGTGTLRQLIADASDGDIIKPHPRLFLSGSCAITLSDSIEIAKNITIQGGNSRLIIYLQGDLRCGADARQYSNNYINFIDVDFRGLWGTFRSTGAGGTIKVFACREVSFTRCTFCGFLGYYATIYVYANPITTTLFQDCAIYGNESVYNASYGTGGIYFGSDEAATNTTIVNCTFAWNYNAHQSYPSHYSSTGFVSVNNIFNFYGSTMGFTSQGNCPTAYSTSFSSGSYYGANIRLTSTSSWRQGAIETTSTVDLDRYQRKVGGALGACEYYAGYLSKPGIKDLEITESSISFTWGSVDGASKYILYSKEPENAFWNEEEVEEPISVVKTGLPSGTTYEYKIVAIPANQDYAQSPEVVVVATTLTKLTTPTIRLVLGDNNSVTAYYSDVANASSYTLMYRVSWSSDWQTCTTTQNSYAIASSSTNRQTYYVKVKADGVGDYVDSLYSEEISKYSLIAPTNLSATNNAVITNSAKVTVSWTAVPNATSYTLEYKQSTASTWSSVSQTKTSRSFTNLTRNTSYDFRVTAIGDGTTFDNSEPSSVVAKTTKSQLATPTGFTCTNKTATSLTFSWNEVSGTKTYNLGYKLPSASSYTYLTPSSSPATITGLTAGTTYQVYISARTPTDSTNYDGSVYTSPVSIATLAPLSAPTGLTHDQVTSNSARVGWNAVTNATDYKVEYRVQGATNWTEDQQ